MPVSYTHLDVYKRQVYAGGAIRSGIRMAELGEKMAELDVEKNRQEVRFLLTGYYLDPVSYTHL